MAIPKRIADAKKMLFAVLYLFIKNPSRPYRKVEEQSCHTADDGTVNPDSLHFIFDTVLCHACHLSAVVRRERFGDTAGNFFMEPADVVPALF